MPTAIKTKNEFQVLHILVRYTDDDFDKQRVIRMSNQRQANFRLLHDRLKRCKYHLVYIKCYEISYISSPKERSPDLIAKITRRL